MTITFWTYKYAEKIHTWSIHEIPVGQILMREGKGVICLLELWHRLNTFSVYFHTTDLVTYCKYHFSLTNIESYTIQSPKWLKYPFNIIQYDRNLFQQHVYTVLIVTIWLYFSQRTMEDEEDEEKMNELAKKLTDIQGNFSTAVISLCFYEKTCIVFEKN